MWIAVPAQGFGLSTLIVPCVPTGVDVEVVLEPGGGLPAVAWAARLIVVIFGAAHISPSAAAEPPPTVLANWRRDKPIGPTMSGETGSWPLGCVVSSAAIQTPIGS